MSDKVYIIGRIRDGRFESYRGALFATRRDARDYVEDQFKPRSGWTAYEAVDLMSHLADTNGSESSGSTQSN